MRAGEDSEQVPDWLMIVAAAFLPGTPAGSLSVAFDIGGRPISPDEQAFYDFLPLDN
jgi:hypothetical protein